MSTLYAYIICEFSTEVVPSFGFQYRGCTKFLCLWTKFVQVSEFSTKKLRTTSVLNSQIMYAYSVDILLYK